MMLSTTPIVDTSSTPIRVMHKRYEAASAEYNLADETQGAAALAGKKGDEDEQSRAYRLREGMKANNYETDTLRQAILYQIPHDPTDALILQYHIWVAADLVLNAEKGHGEADRRALEAALDAAFDFYASESESSVDHEALGANFKRGTMLAWERRRYRTGLVED